jgi:hypothetical protein
MPEISISRSIARGDAREIHRSLAQSRAILPAAGAAEKFL